MTETEKDDELMSTLGDDNRISNLHKGRLHDPRHAQAIVNTPFFQKLADEARYLLDSENHNYEHGGKVWFDTNGHPM